MATSGTTTFSETRQQIIHDAMALIGVYGIGRTVSAADMDVANRFLNKMVKAWQAQGIHLWAKSEGYLFPTKGVASYTLDGSSARFCARSDAAITTLTSAAASSATSLTVNSITGIASGDAIGVELSDGTAFWTTVSGSPSGSTVNLASGLTGAAGANAMVYVYTTKLGKPLRILSMRKVTGSSTETSSIPMNKLSHEEYYDLVNKNSEGVPSHFQYDPLVSSGTLNIWPTPAGSESYLEVTFERQLEDLTADGQTFDFPAEWLEVLTYQLAVRLCSVFGVPGRLQDIQMIAMEMLQDKLSWDNEVNYIQLSIERGY